MMFMVRYGKTSTHGKVFISLELSNKGRIFWPLALTSSVVMEMFTVIYATLKKKFFKKGFYCTKDLV